MKNTTPQDLPVVPETEPMSVPLLHERAPLLPPVTARVLGRFMIVYTAVWILGLTLLLAGTGRVQILGAELLVPGGGHFAHGHVLFGVVALVSMVAAVLLWWMVGAFVAPFIVWGLNAAWAVAMPSHHHIDSVTVAALSAVVPTVLALAVVAHALRHQRRRGVAARTNLVLKELEVPVTRVPSTPVLPVGEASIEDLTRLRLAFDLALQPLDRFDGFDRRDQFREAALRYQLSILGYTLSTYRYNYAPAFSGYLAEAAARSIHKMSDRRVWGYWALENAWGRMKSSRDPVANTDNIMLTGWQGVAAGMFESLEDDRFSQPEALTYRWSDTESYANDFHSLSASIDNNMRRSPFTLYSCEPRWIYPVCNTFGVNTLVMHDRLHGTHMFGDLEESIRRAYLEEFHRPDGRIIGVRSETAGISWSPWSGDGVWLPTTYWMHAAMPDLAHRSWWLMRDTVLRHDGERFHLPRTLANRVDAGSYSFGRDTFGQIMLAMAAREIGDEDVAANVLSHLDHHEPNRTVNGATVFTETSTQGNLYSLMARFGRHSGLRDLVGHGSDSKWLRGPRLADASYPDVLVGRAVSDGVALECVLHPGAERKRVHLTIDNAQPERDYMVVGAVETTVMAGRDGRFALTVDLGGRTELRIEPQS
ncbi:linalool dehydratase/isomerase domain-containing protein [Rhodococcoides navarretei]|uniref:Linalool dehydratase/isomerase domain-containing protein n=1 Tax=Rhodococcus navarretei TaxID=3128981 RepID=A0ABU9D283_9NOCA